MLSPLEIDAKSATMHMSSPILQIAALVALVTYSNAAPVASTCKKIITAKNFSVDAYLGRW